MCEETTAETAPRGKNVALFEQTCNSPNAYVANRHQCQHKTEAMRGLSKEPTLISFRITLKHVLGDYLSMIASLCKVIL